MKILLCHSVIIILSSTFLNKTKNKYYLFNYIKMVTQYYIYMFVYLYI